MLSRISEKTQPWPARLALLLIACSGCTNTRESSTRPEGQPASTETQVLKGGAKALQTDTPVASMNVYLVGFHPMKAAPSDQMEAHHFCRQVNEDVAQCVLFDGNTASANLNGVEYIISGRLFDSLPDDEKQYWHPHNYEILSGMLAGPGLPGPAEKEFMRKKINSYGKTWHFWKTNHGDKLPVGEPMLAWSFNRDGELKPELLAARDQKMGIDTGAKRRERQNLVQLARPQSGVDDLKGRFPRGTRDIAGVVDRRSGSR